MSQVKNILFIMCDQLRWDYLSCYGHPHLKTPHIDRLAERGVRFNRAYVQSPLCGPSRASTYTSRYMSSHGASVNFSATRPDELGMGDYLEPLGLRTALVGKSHAFPDREGMKRLNIDPDSDVGRKLANLSFEPYWRDDGLHPIDQRSQNSEYNRYLRELGYEGVNPWNRHANSVIDEDGERINGWFLKGGIYPADIKEEHSETPYTTRKAMQFMDEAGDQPWCLHLSYIKPHWPYIAPAPYHDMYGPETWVPLNAEEEELDDGHPIYLGYTQSNESQSFQRPEARAAVIQPYMGLIKQIDDQLGGLFQFMDERGLTDNTMIVFTSDHGDYLGDHWMGEKSWFHDCSVRVPFIVVDPSTEADATRGTASDAFVEQIDLLPTFIEAVGGSVPIHRVEGRSLLPLLAGETPADWRRFAVSEVDFADRFTKYYNDIPHEECNAVMICSTRWKYVHVDNYRPQLFDLENDPHEVHDLGADPAYSEIVSTMKDHLIHFLLRRRTRVTIGGARIDQLVKPPSRERRGIYIGYFSEEDLPDLSKDD